jgi:hypothetical protein
MMKMKIHEKKREEGGGGKRKELGRSSRNKKIKKK